ncbi:hypothetical protein GF377_05865 [candidate division GN15 bacterium]|nr:hypothetical protein [candidate division GN15 bacterium]
MLKAPGVRRILTSPAGDSAMRRPKPPLKRYTPSQTRDPTIKTAEIRQSFLDYFVRHDHQLVASSPVIPYDDPTILFANAGMNQFKDVFTGKRKPDHPRATSSQ